MLLRSPLCLLAPRSSLPISCGISSYRIATPSSRLVLHSPRLFRLTLALVEAVRKLLAMLVTRMVRQHLLTRGTLECLEASFALDRLGRDVLFPQNR
jgi:hypothetical protein